jgi:hypothetical protein
LKAANLFTYPFLHSGWLHLLFNLLMLFVVAPFVEDVWGRPLFAGFYLAAGAVAVDGSLLAHRERLWLAVAEADRAWVDAAGSDIPVDVRPDDTPDRVGAHVGQELTAVREELERAVVVDVRGDGIVLVDGSLVGRDPGNDVVGIVKTTRRIYLPDESSLHSLPERHRSARFTIPAGAHGASTDRYSTYVRLHDAALHAWDHALIRVETFDPDLLDPVAAYAYANRQPVRSSDSRADRHLAPVRAVEVQLRARRPDVFTLR